MNSDLIPLGRLGQTGVDLADRGQNEVQVQSVNGIQERPGLPMLHIRRRDIEIEGSKYAADPHDLMAMIRTVTQQIGDHKDQDNLLSRYMVSGLRKVRSTMVADLQKFGIHWEIDKQTGESYFWL